MKKVDTLIIAGASITASPWYTWSDIVIEAIEPVNIIDLSAKGTGNYYIATSCINAINNLIIDNKNVLVMPMFTNLDKFDMYLDSNDTKKYRKEKHFPIDLKGKQAKNDNYSFWCTGSHWPLVKQNYFENFWNPDVAVTNNILIFFALEQLCKQKNISLFPLYDSDIWNVLECDLNKFVAKEITQLPARNMTDQSFCKNFYSMLNQKWYKTNSIIEFAIANDYEYYSDRNKLHPSSEVHLEWYRQHIEPELKKQFECKELSNNFLSKIAEFTNLWK